MSPTLPNTAWPARRILQWGLLWGLLLSVAEFLVIAPLHATPAASFLIWWLVIWLLPMWCAVGCLLLLLAQRCEARRSWLLLAVGAVALLLAWSVAQALYAQHMHQVGSGFRWFSHIMFSTGFQRSPASDLAVYNLWVGLFYGGLLVTAYLLMVRGERMRRLLREAALARSRTEALLGQTRLQGLQAQVDPKLLLSALDEVQALYRREPARADALLDRLVEFLRAAVPGLKQRRSTLQAELQLARTYAQLQALLPGGRRWAIELPAAMPELPFPSLLLLPLLGRPTRHDAPCLAVDVAEGRATLTLQGLGGELPPPLVQHMRACLQQLLGAAARLRSDEFPTPQLVIELDFDPRVQEAPR